MCLLNKYEARNLKNLVFEIDDKAFLFSTSVIEAYGEGFEKQVKYSNLFKTKKKNKKENNEINNIQNDKVIAKENIEKNENE